MTNVAVSEEVLAKLSMLKDGGQGISLAATTVMAMLGAQRGNHAGIDFVKLS